jgi:hypothetical protein
MIARFRYRIYVQLVDVFTKWTGKYAKTYFLVWLFPIILSTSFQSARSAERVPKEFSDPKEFIVMYDPMWKAENVRKFKGFDKDFDWGYRLPDLEHGSPGNALEFGFLRTRVIFGQTPQDCKEPVLTLLQFTKPKLRTFVHTNEKRIFSAHTPGPGGGELIRTDHLPEHKHVLAIAHFYLWSRPSINDVWKQILEKDFAMGAASNLIGLRQGSTIELIKVPQEQLEYRASRCVFDDVRLQSCLESTLFESIITKRTAKKSPGRKAEAENPLQTIPVSEDLPHEKYESNLPFNNRDRLEYLAPSQVLVQGRSATAVFNFNNTLLLPIKVDIAVRHDLSEKPIAKADLKIDPKQATSVRVEIKDLSRDDISALKKGRLTTPWGIRLECP